jgi:hypothetical protein
LRDWTARFRGWKDASLLRRVVVTVAGFVMLTCVSIGTMSFVAVAATRAVFKPSNVPGASASSASDRSTSEVASEGAGPPHSPTALKKSAVTGRTKPKTDLTESGGDSE